MSTMLFCHFDIEADGASPLEHNMIAIGVSFTNNKGDELGTFLGDLKNLEGHNPDEDTMNWWKSNESKSKELKRIQDNAKDANEVMRDLSNKLREMLDKTGFKRMLWIAKPASYDWQWLNCYYTRFLNSLSKDELNNTVKLPFKATCMSTMRDVWQHTKNIPKKDAEEMLATAAKGLEITHNPLDDCRCQSRQYFYLCEELGIKL